jgi:hypothetical protein
MNTESHDPNNAGTRPIGVCRTLTPVLDPDRDFSGDFSGADFMGVELNGYKRRHRGTRLLTLSGSFVGARFDCAEISDAVLSGDFSDAEFSGATFHGCVLSGKFDGARDLGTAISLSAPHIEPSASFKGADLRGIGPRLVNPEQIDQAQILLTDRVDVKTGRSMDWLGRTLELVQPAQCLKNVTVVDPEGRPCNSEQLPLHVEFVYDLFLYECAYDVAAISGTLDGQKRPPTFWPENQLAVLHAPGVALRRFVEPFMSLRGDFANGCLEQSEIGTLRLYGGSFVGFDLRRSTIRRLDMKMDTVVLDGLKFSESIKMVSFWWSAGERGNWFETSARIAAQVIQVWDSADGCEALAENIIRHSKTCIDSKALLRSHGQTIDGIGGRYVSYRDEVFVSFGLIARRNQLQRSAGQIRRLMIRRQGDPLPQRQPLNVF